MEEMKMENSLRKINKEADLNEDERKIIEECRLIRNKIFKTTKEGADKDDPNFYEGHNFIVNLVNKLRKVYPDTQKCFLFHVLNASGCYDEMDNGYFDFPGEDSIYKILLKWEQDKNSVYENLKKWQQKQLEKK